MTTHRRRGLTCGERSAMDRQALQKELAVATKAKKAKKAKKELDVWDVYIRTKAEKEADEEASWNSMEPDLPDEGVYDERDDPTYWQPDD